MTIRRTSRIRQHTFVVAFSEPHTAEIELLARELGTSPETVIRNAMLKELEPRPDRSLPAVIGQLARRVTERRSPNDPFEQLRR